MKKMERIETGVESNQTAHVNLLDIKVSGQERDCMYKGILGIFREIFALMEFPFARK